MVEAGTLRPVIEAELPMTQAGAAHEIMAASTHTGKIVLRTK
jgi:NADPH:quinone reductase-like Zn-dependent oxidoreductase